MSRIIAAIVLVAVLAVGGGIVATTAYQAGLNTAVTTTVTDGTTVVTPVVAPYAYGIGYGWHPFGFGFGFFGFLFTLFFLFLVFGLIRALIFGADRGRRGGWGGPGWAARRPPVALASPGPRHLRGLAPPGARRRDRPDDGPARPRTHRRPCRRRPVRRPAERRPSLPRAPGHHPRGRSASRTPLRWPDAHRPRRRRRSRRSSSSRATTSSTPASRVLTAADGRAALETARRQHPDLVVLDLGLPGLDGLEVTRELRRDSTIPIVMLTARDDELDKLLGLELGADDYLTKPFSPRELVARVRAVLRRTERAAEPGDVDPRRRSGPRRAADAGRGGRTDRRPHRRPSSGCWPRWPPARAGSSPGPSCSTRSAASPSSPTSARSTRTSRTCAARSSPTRASRATC